MSNELRKDYVQLTVDPEGAASVAEELLRWSEELCNNARKLQGSDAARTIERAIDCLRFAENIQSNVFVEHREAFASPYQNLENAVRAPEVS